MDKIANSAETSIKQSIYSITQSVSQYGLRQVLVFFKGINLNNKKPTANL